MWYKAWREMLQGVLLEMSLVEHRGGDAGLVVGISSRSSSGSTIGIAYVVGLVRVVGLLGFFVGLGRRSWMETCGVVCAVTCLVGGLTSTLGGGDAGGLLGWRVDGGPLLGWLTSWRVGRFVGWLTSWRIGRFTGWLARRSLVGRVGGGSRGLQLLATTVSSSSSSSERM